MHQTLAFGGSSTGISVGYVTAADSTRDNVFKSVDASLASFFERPIIARTDEWTPLQAAPFTAIFDPWSLYFGNPRVINRINNYQMLRATLHVRFVVNGNGFYFGRLMADYNPLASTDSMSEVATLEPLNAIQASQRMKVFIDPVDSCSCQMDLPFVYYEDAVNVALAHWSRLGSITVRQLAGLKHANGSAQPITISTFIWATNVEYAIPTVVNSSALVVQAGDEYSQPGPVENMATATAAAADMASKLPVIGPYAKATSMMAGAAAKAASVMGWSRPADIRPLDPMRPTFVSALAPSDAGDTTTKMTVDSKQELTVSSKVIGIDLPDELNIAAIAARESYLTSFTWATTRVAGDRLFAIDVTPAVCGRNGAAIYPPACAFASRPFRFWRCKMRYRFQVVSSMHHKGRLRIVWDPKSVATTEANVQYTKIVDISDDRDVVIDVDWGQTTHYLEQQTPNLSAAIYGTAITTSTLPFHNGVLGLFVLNELATPNSSINNDIQVNVFVSSVDLDVAMPQDLSQNANAYGYVVQAGDEAGNDGDDPGTGEADADYHFAAMVQSKEDMLVYFGERITSFRQMLRRYNLHSTFYVVNSTPAAPATYTMVATDYPAVYGYNSQTLHTTTAAGKFNYVQNTMLAYLSPAFVAMRGGMRSKYVFSSSGASQVLSATARNEVPATAITNGTTTITVPTASQSAYARAVTVARRSLCRGAALTPAGFQPVLEVEHPYYKPVRFDEARLANSTATTYSNPYYLRHAVDVVLAPGSDPTIIDRYTGVAEDFSLFWFQGCPTQYTLGSPV